MSKAKLKTASAQLAEAKAQLELAETQTMLKILESPQPVRVPFSDYPQYEEFANGFRPPYVWTDITDREGDKYLPYYWNNSDLRRMRARGRNFEAFFPVAIGAKDRLTNYVIGKGLTFEVQPKSQEHAAIAKQAQAEIDRFCEYNNFCGVMDREIHERTRVEGEAFPTLYPEDENVRCELNDPDYFVQPDNTRELELFLRQHGKINYWNLGVHTQHNRAMGRDDVSRPLGYFAEFDNLGSNWDYLPAARVQHIKRNVGRQARRGWGDYEAVYDRIEQEAKLERNTAVGAAILAAIAYFRKHAEGVTQSGVQSLVASNAATTYPTGPSGVSRNVEQINPGTVKDIPYGMEPMLGPLGTLRSPIYIEVAQFVLRIASVRWDIPEFMISGDASNQNLNSATLAYESFVKSREADQGFYASHFEELAWKVLRMRWEKGAFGNLAWQVLCRAIGVKATMPDVSGLSKDTEKMARENETLNRMGIKSKRTIAAELNLDYDEEQRNIAKEPKTQEPAVDMGQNTKYAAMVGAIEAELDRDGVRALVESFREEKEVNATP